VTCSGVSPVLAPDGHGLVCTNCGRDVATYGGKQQHKRGGAGGTRALTQIEVTRMLPDRLDAIDRHQASMLAALAAINVRMAEQTRAIDRFLDRQPIVLEVRPGNRRLADGGENGRVEVRRTTRKLREEVGE
jgi:hypothetical protein